MVFSFRLLATLDTPLSEGGLLVSVEITEGDTQIIYTMQLAPPTRSRKHCSSWHCSLNHIIPSNTIHCKYWHYSA